MTIIFVHRPRLHQRRHLLNNGLRQRDLPRLPAIMRPLRQPLLVVLAAEGIYRVP
jgi:hypothetical protein